MTTTCITNLRERDFARREETGSRRREDDPFKFLMTGARPTEGTVDPREGEIFTLSDAYKSRT